MNIYLVRHAQSESNVNPEILHQKTNIGVDITDIGLKQAQETGEFFVNILKQQPDKKITIWNSPYERTRKTSKIIQNSLIQNSISHNTNETIYLSERQFGLVDNIPLYQVHFKHEAEHYSLHKNHQHDFFARPPLGESPFDMCMRLDFFIKTVLSQEADNSTHILVTHGAAIKGLMIMLLNQTYEQFNQPNPHNASVHLFNGENKTVSELFCPSIRTK